jgi:hypothetical protein
MLVAADREMMLVICSDEILYVVLRAAGATQDVKSK